VNINNGLTLIEDSNYIRINHPNHRLFNAYLSNVVNETYVIVSGVQGSAVQGTALLNIPINEINRKHQVFFKRTDSDIPNPNFYYIKVDTFAEDDYEYALGDVNIYFLMLYGIPIHELNANYPLSVEQINGYHIITNIVDDHHYEIATKSTSSTNVAVQTGGDKCWVAKIQDFIEGYPNNNYYKIALKKTFYNVRKIRLVSTEFPNTERVIKDYPEKKKNNALYFQISNDGNTVYKIEVTPGNYTIVTLKEEIESKISQIERATLGFLNTNVVNNNYYYKTNITSEIDIQAQTDTFIIKLYETIIVQKPFTLLNSVDQDGFKRMRVFHPNHKLTANDKVVISNASSTENVPSEILNTSHFIEKVLDKDNYQIKLPRYNALESDTTNGGDAVTLVYPLKFRLLFDRMDTIGKILGFSNVGKSTSITIFNTEITNTTPYDTQTDLNTIKDNVINLSGDNYIIMSCPLFKESFSSGPIDGVFAKLLLASDPGTVMYNQFVQINEDFPIPIPSLSEFEVSFFDPFGELFYFNNIEHSYSLEIHEDINQEK
jgi:hypothetical protein